MSIVYFGVVLIAIWLIVEVLSIVFRITGLDLRKARFQVISILTHTGFTTRESELIAQHPLRRRLASALMLVSYLAQVSLISLLLNMISQNINQLLYVALGLAGVIAVFLFLTRNKYVSSRFDRLIEKVIARRFSKQKHSIDQVLKISPEYGVYEILVDSDSVLAGRALKDVNLSEQFIHVLKVDSGASTVDFPSADYVVGDGDVLIVYGKIKSIKTLMTQSE